MAGERLVFLEEIYTYITASLFGNQYVALGSWDNDDNWVHCDYTDQSTVAQETDGSISLTLGSIYSEWMMRTKYIVPTIGGNGKKGIVRMILDAKLPAACTFGLAGELVANGGGDIGCEASLSFSNNKQQIALLYDEVAANPDYLCNYGYNSTTGLDLVAESDVFTNYSQVARNKYELIMYISQKDGTESVEARFAVNNNMIGKIDLNKDEFGFITGVYPFIMLHGDVNDEARIYSCQVFS